MSDDGQRLYLGQIYFIERQDAEHHRERALLVGQLKHQTRLVGLGQRTQQVGLLWCRAHKETGKVVLVVLNTVFQNLQSIEPRSLSMTDSCPPVVLALGNHLGRTGRIFGLDSPQFWMVLQIVARLHQGHGVRVHLGDGVPRVVGQTTDAMGDVQFVLANHRCARIAQQFVVVEQRTGNGVLDGGHSDDRRVLLDGLVDLLERRTTDELQLVVLEILVGGYVVETSDLALYGYSFHIVFIKTNPAFTSVKRDLVVFFISLCRKTYARLPASQLLVK